ncbi:MAG: VOC family protein [Actinomycetota bacterium]
MRRIGYVIRYVRDLEASIRFYRDVIGLGFKFSEHGYAEFDAGGIKFGLYERGRLPELIGEEPEPGTEGEILVPVEDVDAEANRLRSAGVEAPTDPVDRPWGHRTLHVRDPDGYVIELAQEIERTRPRGA